MISKTIHMHNNSAVGKGGQPLISTIIRETWWLFFIIPLYTKSTIIDVEADRE